MAVLDFGAGSLRESFELCGRGYRVTACDIDPLTLAGYAADYDWGGNPPRLAGSIEGGPFELITAFDVFEHLEQPETTLAAMAERLTDTGLIFATVPNALTAYEIIGQIYYRIGLARGRRMTPGEPHIQFKTPGGWRRFFEVNGFEIVEHDMAIGPFVNTWAAIVQTVTLATRKAMGQRGDRSTAGVLGTAAGPRVMASLNRMDRATAAATRGVAGWNLFVLKPRRRAGPAAGA